MSLILDGTAGVTFPNSTIQASAGQVLQIVTATTTSTTSTSAGPTTTGLTATITPKFSSSKILVTVQGRAYNTTQNNENYWYIYRASSSVWNTRTLYTSTGGGLAAYQQISYLDSPATTSATTYTLYMSTAGGLFYYFVDVSSMITLMEIAG